MATLVLLAVALVVLGLWPDLTGFLTFSPGGDTIQIGALLPLSGKNAVYGIEIKNAIELAKSEINSDGGINGKRLTVIFEDDQADAAIGTSAMQKLTQVDRVPVVIGSWASGVVVATAPIAEKNKTVVMAIAIAPSISNAGDYIFRIQPSAVFYTQKSVSFLRDRNFSSAAVIFVNNEFGKSLSDAFVADWAGSGASVIAIESFAQGDSDFKTQLSKIKAVKPEVVFIAGYQETIAVIKQMRELDLNATILAGPPFESQSTISALGNEAEGVLYAYHFISGNQNSKAQTYEQNYWETYGVPTGGFAPLAYDATHIIANALKKCDSNSDCIKKEIYNTKGEGVVGPITFDANGDPDVPIVMKTVKNGKFVRFDE